MIGVKCLLSYCDTLSLPDKNYCPKHEKLPIRSQIIAPKGKRLIQVDLSQAEAWIVAFLANEKKMKEALQYGDVHCLSAAMFGWAEHPWEYYLRNKDKSSVPEDKRYLSKRINHGSNYRMGPFRLTEVINKDSDKAPYITVTNSETKKLQAAWLDFYNLKSWWTELEETLKSHHYLITPYGRKRNFYGAVGDGNKGLETYKEATAYIPQSTVADHCFGKVQKELGIEGGLYNVYKEICEPSNGEIKIINTSHDSGILEIPTGVCGEIAEKTVRLMKRPIVINGEEFTIPVDCEVGDRWGEMEKLKIAA